MLCGNSLSKLSVFRKVGYLIGNSVCARLRNVTKDDADRSAREKVRKSQKPVSLKELAEHLGLSPATVSLVMNKSTVADSIPQETKDRIRGAAKKLNYRLFFCAKSLRARRSFTIGVIGPEVGDGFWVWVRSGVKNFLRPTSTRLTPLTR